MNMSRVTETAEKDGSSSVDGVVEQGVNQINEDSGAERVKDTDKVSKQMDELNLKDKQT